MITVGLVGLGWWGKKLAQSIGESSMLRVVRGVETNSSAIQGFAGTSGFPISADYSSVLELCVGTISQRLYCLCFGHAGNTLSFADCTLRK